MGLQRRGALSARHTGELAAELAPLVAGWRVRDVRALPPRDVVLALEAASAQRDDARPPRRLRLSADPAAPRFHLVGERVRSHRGPLGPFFRRLEAELAGCTLTSLEQVGRDRIVRVGFAREHGGRDEQRGLVLELIGRHSNLVLVDGEDRVLEMLVPPPAPKEQGADGEARLSVGAPWRPPPGQPPADPGPPLAEAFPLDAAELASAREAPLSRRVELTLGAAAEESYDAARRADLTQRLKRKRKLAEQALAGLAERRRAAAEAERVRQDGELLQSVQAALRRGQREAVVDDWFVPGAPKRTIELDPKLTPRENVERLFKRYQKLARDADGLDEEEARAKETAARIAGFLAEAADPAVDPDELEERLIAAGHLAPRQEPGPKKTRAAEAPRVPYRTFRAKSGAEIRVGKSARDNDTLSLKLSRGSDVWLHTAEAPGSHVVLRAEKGAEPDPEDVLDAAHLALHFSPLRGARRADIHVARCKDVKKPKGAKPGLVLLSGGRILHLRVEEERLRALLEGRR